jgi:hypothetical protein
MLRLSLALAAVVLLVPIQATAIPIIFQLSVDSSLETDFNSGSSRFAALADFWSGNGAFGGLGSAFGMSGSGFGSGQRGRSGGWRGLFGNGWGEQNGDGGEGFANALAEPGTGLPITPPRWGRFGGVDSPPWFMGGFPAPVTPAAPGPSITEVPEPSTFAFLVAGFVAAGVGRYRRRRVSP